MTNIALRNWRNLNKWRDLPCSWIERLNIVKLTSLPELHNNKSNSNQNPGYPPHLLFFLEIDRLILKFFGVLLWWPSKFFGSSGWASSTITNSSSEVMFSAFLNDCPGSSLSHTKRIEVVGYFSKTIFTEDCNMKKPPMTKTIPKIIRASKFFNIILLYFVL